MNPFQQVSDVLGQAVQQAPVFAQQLSAIAAPFAHGLPAPTPPSQTGSTGQAVLVGFGAVALVGLGAWLLSGREWPKFFGAVAFSDLDANERAALKHLSDPDYDFPPVALWDDVLARLQAKGLMVVQPNPNRPGYDLYVLTRLGEQVLSDYLRAPVPDTLRTPVQEEPTSSVRSKPRYSLAWEESA